MKNDVVENNGLPLVPPAIVPLLDPDFRPAVLANRAFRQSVAASAVPVWIALERADGGISRFDTVVAGEGSPVVKGNFVYAERLVKFLLWSRGGWKVHFSGPDELGRRLQTHYREVTTGKFDAAIMGGKIYERPFEVALVAADDVPAAHLPRVDAIGGSSAGVYVNNRVQVASLFRGVPEEVFNERVKPIFFQLKKAWNDIPFDVVNDGEVTALAGSMSINDNAVLGIALGSSQAVGYVTPEGNITSWLNELAFAPVDYHPQAPLDEWSGDYGCGVQYFSQQCVGRLIPKAGIAVDAKLPLPEKLVEVQKLMSRGDERAAKIYQTIGVYLGYAVAHYAEFYGLRHLLILGRVTTGQGGEVILREAREVLKQEFPELASVIAFHMPDEKEKRHGQAMAAASLPVRK